MFKNFFSPKRQRVIEAVKDYFNGKAKHIPFSDSDIKETLEWVEQTDIPNKEMLKARLNMALLLAQAKA